MSYSRWGDSVWYTYWGAYSDKFPRDEQEFVVCSIGEVTYGEMKKDFESAVGRLVEQGIAQGKREFMAEGAFEPTPEELAELRGYMREFMAEVEEEFGSDA